MGKNSFRTVERNNNVHTVKKVKAMHTVVGLLYVEYNKGR